MVYYKFIYIISYNIESVNIAFWEKKKAGLAQAPVPLYFPYYYASFANLQGSQTLLFQRLTKWKFYTITNLQGSQTSNEIITEPNISVNMRKPPSNV